MNEYPHSPNSLYEGNKYQEFVINKLNSNKGWGIINFHSRYDQVYYGENPPGMEIKLDSRIRETGNLYFEYAEKSDPLNKSYVPSGICRKDNTFLWLQGDYIETYFMFKSQLVELSENKQWKRKKIATSKGFIVPLQYLLNKGYVGYTLKHV